MGMVRSERFGERGSIVLDRPAALNALNLDMVRAIKQALIDFAADRCVEFVTISSSTPRAFCAGGDLRTIRDAAVAGDMDQVRSFFAEEYILNSYIANYPKPYISLIQGICMGGGLGLSVHGAKRVVGQGTFLSMPEVAIGFFTDIGASYFLNRLPGRLGMYIGLTGTRLNAADAHYSGLATDVVTDDMLARMVELSPEGNLACRKVLASNAGPTEPGSLKELQPAIDEAFSKSSVEEIHSALKRIDSDWARSALAHLLAASPTSVFTTHALLQYTTAMPLTDCFALELEIALGCVNSFDFLEGTRALLVDKDKTPRWGEADPTVFKRAVELFAKQRHPISTTEWSTAFR